jgi:hypothetical protein
MIQKIALSSLLALSVLGSNLSAFSFSLPTTTTQTCAEPTVIDTSVLNDSTNLSFQVLQTSTALLRLSESILNSGTTVNSDYLDSMLQLSTDIGTMADRIGEMADRILITEGEIGIMADRILETQTLQNENVALTQTNLLRAQINFTAAAIAE